MKAEVARLKAKSNFLQVENRNLIEIVQDVEAEAELWVEKFQTLE